MTRQELKDRIRRGDSTPGVSQALFEAVYLELVEETHPGSRLVTLQESRGSHGGLPEGVHDRVARMLDGRREQVQPLTEARSDVKDDSVFDPPIRDAATLGNLLRAAAARFKASNDPAAITARALNRDGEPKPFRLYPVRTLQEAKAEADRLPKGIHAFVASRM